MINSNDPSFLQYIGLVKVNPIIPVINRQQQSQLNNAVLALGDHIDKGELLQADSLRSIVNQLFATPNHPPRKISKLVYRILPLSCLHFLQSKPGIYDKVLPENKLFHKMLAEIVYRAISSRYLFVLLGKGSQIFPAPENLQANLDLLKELAKISK